MKGIKKNFLRPIHYSFLSDPFLNGSDLYVKSLLLFFSFFFLQTKGGKVVFTKCKVKGMNFFTFYASSLLHFSQALLQTVSMQPKKWRRPNPKNEDDLTQKMKTT